MSQQTEAPEFSYVGGELSLFEKATNWKRYWSSQIAPYLSGDVLEVGAGIGSNTKLLTQLPFRSWTCLEPDPALAREIDSQEPRVRVKVGTLADCGATERFDSILYIDVLEHIHEDREEISRATRHLRPGGHLIVLSPAHQFLFTPFDKAIGHYRRYSLGTLADTARPLQSNGGQLDAVSLRYLDSAGMLASLANRLLLSQSMPTERQILTWDRLLVPVSRVLDSLLLGRVGKSVLGIWRREA